MNFAQTFTLSNGVVMPALGLGTWLLNNQEAEQAVLDALNMGYRHIDTAQAYQNEKGVGQGFRRSGLPRDQVFITTKIAAEHKTYGDAMASLEASLEESGLDYFDLVLIHSPQPWVEVNQSDNRHFEGNLAAWSALEDAYEAGRVKSIGVSNFLEVDLQNLLDKANIKPMVNQVLSHIGNTPIDLIDFCQANDILVQTYSPIGHGAILHNPAIKAIADKYEVTVAQLSLKYNLQLGLVVLPKTAKVEHMKNNADLSFEISEEDMAVLKKMDKITDYGDHSFFPVFGGKL